MWSPSFIIAACLLRAATAVTPPPLHCYLGTTPTLDGVLSPSEWADATLFGDVFKWDAQFSPVDPATSPLDLNVTVFTKHDGRRLYFAFEVQDNALYALDTPPWLPTANPLANDMAPRFPSPAWPWFGDEFEILLNAPNAVPSATAGVTGVPGVWQMVVNAHKSRLGGWGVGGLLEGEPRSSDTAWENYQQWIYSRAMEAAVAVAPAGGGGAGGRWSAEFAADFNPLLQVAPGAWWNASWPPTRMGLNIALGDTDGQEQASQFGLRHEMWWSGNTSCQGGGNCHTWLYQFGELVMEPGPR
jgi:SSS family solute:Na+ symporter